MEGLLFSARVFSIENQITHVKVAWQELPKRLTNFSYLIAYWGFHDLLYKKWGIYQKLLEEKAAKGGFFLLEKRLKLLLAHVFLTERLVFIPSKKP